jgi:hypothetical protein
MQFDLLRDYSKQNLETNLLYFDFNNKAKILYLACVGANSREFSTESIFSITEALNIFQEQNNYRGAGTCYMILGCMFASLTEEISSDSN